MSNKIIWTKIDEAPELASYSLLPIIKSYLKNTGIEVEIMDISLAGRVLANFPDYLTEEQRIPDYLSILGELVKSEDANVIKLPNISATIPQLIAAIKELQEKGYKIPDYPEEPKNDEEQKIKDRYSKVIGSAVNPVLREGNSDRRPAQSVKLFAKKYPHKMMKHWPREGSKCRVAYMKNNDFYGNENSLTINEDKNVKIVFKDNNGNRTVLKDTFKLIKDEVIDTTKMQVKYLRNFYEEEIKKAKEDEILFSLHLKATMMKVSDPIMFGHCVDIYYKEVLDKHKETLNKLNIHLNSGIADLYEKIKVLPENERLEIENDIQKLYDQKAELAMVDSREGITNLHIPNNIIIDASMPVVVRDGGKMWNRKDELQDCVAVIPDRSYATIYEAIIENCKTYGQFDPSTMGNVSNVGLMAQKAEEYGSHDKTFEAKDDGEIFVEDEKGNILLSQTVEKGDIFRMCQTKDAAIKDWVKLAVNRANATKNPAIFWLDNNRAHDREIIKKVETYLKDYDISQLEIKILSPVDAMNYTLKRVRQGLDTISVTGNVLRDYLTDLFPILELGTSSRMLSIVPLLNGGGLFETGAGGSAPKHVQQFIKEGHLRWDSLGEYCALVPSLELIYYKYNNTKAKILAVTLDKAIYKYLENGKYPSRKVKEIDNRGSSFYLSLYWAEYLSEQNDDLEIKERFTLIYNLLKENEEKIFNELIECQGKSQNLGGYYLFDDTLTIKAMRPSELFNNIIDNN